MTAELFITDETGIYHRVGSVVPPTTERHRLRFPTEGNEAAIRILETALTDRSRMSFRIDGIERSGFVDGVTIEDHHPSRGVTMAIIDLTLDVVRPDEDA